MEVDAVVAMAAVVDQVGMAHRRAEEGARADQVMAVAKAVAAMEGAQHAEVEEDQEVAVRTRGVEDTRTLRGRGVMIAR